MYGHVSIPPVGRDSSGSLSAGHRLLVSVSFEALTMGALVPPAVFLAFAPWELSGSLLPHKGWSCIHFPKNQSSRERMSRGGKRDKSVLGDFQAEVSV